MENDDLGQSRFSDDDFLQITPPGAAPSSSTRNEPRDFFGPPGALQQRAEETQRPVDYADVGKSAAQGAVLGAGDIVGTPGSIGQLYDLAGEKIMKYGILKPAEFFGALPPGSSDRFIEQAKKVGMSPAEQKGNVNTIFGLPFMTGTGTERAIKENVPGMAEEPATPEGESVQKSVRLGTSLLAPGGGGVAGAAGRFTAGAIGSQIGQGAENLQREVGFIQPGSGYEEYVEPVASVAGTIGALMLGKGVRNVVVPSTKAADDLASAMAKDFGGSEPRVSRDFVMRALQEGNMSMADIFGPGTATRAYIESQAARAGSKGKSIIEDFNNTIAPIEGTTVKRRIPEAQTNVSRTLAGATPYQSLDAAAIQQATQDANLAARRAVYNVVRADPAARAIASSDLGPLVENNQYIQAAVNRISQMAPDLPREWGVIAPTDIRSGNLAFWDAVKRNVDEEISNLASARERLDATDKMRLSSLQQAKEDLLRQVDSNGNLVGGLDYIVPSYPRARAASGELLSQDNAVKTGIEYFNRMGQLDRAQANGVIQAMSPEARTLARTGWLSELNQQIGRPGGVNSIASRIVAEPQFAENARLLLGRDYERVAGSILSQNLKAQAKAIPLAEEGILKAAARYKGPIAGIGAAGLYQAENIANMLAMGLEPTQVAKVLATGAAAATVGGTLNLQASRVANQAVRLALSDRPADHIRLLRLAENDPKLMSRLAKLNAGFQVYNQQPEGEEGQEPQPARADGGRIGRATGGRVGADVEAEALVRAADRAKKSFNKTTEPLLNAPDNHIAKALEVANRAI